MEWIETTGKTVDEARELALEQLGVDEQDAEIQVLEEPKPGMFGRVRGQARVRARIEPRSQRAKPNRRRRTRADEDQSAAAAPVEASSAESSPAPKPRKKAASKKAAATTPATEEDGESRSTGRRQERGDREGVVLSEEAQVETVTAFLAGLADSFGVDATVETSWVDGELHANLAGSGLGRLIGPGGGTMDALQEIARGALQRAAEGGDHAKCVVDVAGVRARRRAALEEFVRREAAEVAASGVAVAFEPMTSVDRKIVHDLANELDGVATVSEGEDPRRRVVLVPAAG